jgi:hypothetical protein
MKPKPQTYLLRDVDGELWRRVKAQAATDGVPLRTVVLELLERYADGRVRPGRSKVDRE